MTGGITQYNGPGVTLAGGSALKKFMENTAAAAKKKIEETGNVEGFKAGFVSADGEISVKITSESGVDEKGRSGYALVYTVDTSDKGAQVAHGVGGTGIMAEAKDVDDFISSMGKMNDDLGTKSGNMTDEEYLNYVKENFPPDQYEKTVKGMEESKRAYEAQQRELSGDSDKASSPASTATSRLDRMKAQSEEGARLAERLLKQAASGHSSRSDDAATWIAQSATEKPDQAPYKPIDLKA
ncbi:hypothetical protein [Azospirillum doebereinerae]|uniref:Uncharacterized protein n=1 Tax=Azospirillum doebereinerae TaxID=92933 RepID=A0A3S0V3D3_9PROT|nr:hypothetical protein [Azospirillum doebereinerae]MCG5241617.1 hypothetical protein [Azospirillum doebereinerae]RUQ62556.1 hypothetical protein EJ913_28470 [Azospirillum doebereinerae]